MAVDTSHMTPFYGVFIDKDGNEQNLVGGSGGGGGTTNHAALSNLGYAQSGHTGFASQADLTTEVQARTAHNTDSAAHSDIRADLLTEVQARTAHNTDTSAHLDIRNDITAAEADISTLAERVAAQEGLGGYVAANDFGVATPVQSDITAYVKDQIWPGDGDSHADTEIFNGTRVENKFDGTVWVLANTPSTTPPVFEWISAGSFGLPIATETTLGGLKSSTNEFEVNIDPVTAIGTLPGIDKIAYGNVGEIFWWPATTPPTDSLVCDGSMVNKTDYPDLYAVIGDQFGSSNTQFKLPDMRGEFVRGYDPTNIRDPQVSRILGTHQDGTGHPRVLMQSSGRLQTVIAAQPVTQQNPDTFSAPSTGTGDIATSSTTPGAVVNTSYTSRPTNISLLPCIRYKKYRSETIEESDPTVPLWAKQPTKPTYVASEVGAASTADLSTEATNREAADVALQARIEAQEGMGGFVAHHDFGVAIPTQEDITAYVKSQIWPENTSDYPDIDIFNGTKVVNDFDNVLWVLSNSQTTNPPIFEWEPAGIFTVGLANETTAGVVKSNSTDLYGVEFDIDGKGTVKGLEDVTFGSIGEIYWWPGTTPPDGSLYCDGRFVSKADYADLYSVIGDTFGVSTTTDFYLPDLRGEFIRGYDPSNVRDPSGSSRVFGGHQDATEVFKQQINSTNSTLVTGGMGASVLGGLNYDGDGNVDLGGYSQTNYASSGLQQITAPGWRRGKFRPTNVSLLPCIRYKTNINHFPLSFSPHLWDVGTEYDLGDGSFGQRFEGNIVQAANTELTTIMPITGVEEVIDFVGWWNNGNSNGKESIGGAAAGNGSTGNPLFFSRYAVTPNVSVNFSTRSSQARTGTTLNAYKVWVRYTKTGGISAQPQVPTVDSLLRLKMSPHNWTPGVEYDFKDGSYGQRFTGTVTRDANIAGNTILTNITQNISIIRVDGNFDVGNGNNLDIHFTTGGITSGVISNNKDTPKTISWNSQISYARTNAPYDIWIIYTK